MPLRDTLLDRRHYRYRHSQLDFFCPLCGTKRALVYGSRLSGRHYGQIFMLSVVLILISYPWFEARVMIWPFIVWGAFEAGVKVLFRKNVPCPHCGFDATWYKRDVRVAKRVVKRFWEEEPLKG